MIYEIAELRLGEGRLGICPMPGRGGDYGGDLLQLLNWAPGLVLTMTSQAELRSRGAADLGADLKRAGIGWHHLPVMDFGSQSERLQQGWAQASTEAHAVLADGGRVLAHCMGGCGRSGMALMRLMVEAGENADPALERLRDVRPCAVETEDQRGWAAEPMWDRLRQERGTD
ncbi:dual specificity protein phosphatase family protein [Candidatus Halocynthiibacter alkanivorans]|jgi:protein-tyrosine phosphatase|uniref:dual specificity protein phosphatase family protein n=1 Tax=Candidatus Halocynthiibacter alkanivorans TaxID=2267619 RepID=UPI000DF162CD|nr:dual specificity protein phosphatase family protein [Candidatus Halocynthiibacter alkanivorans]